MRVPQVDSDLRGRESLFGEFANVFNDVGRILLEPRGGGPPVWQGGLGDALSFAVHASHGGKLRGGRRGNVDFVTLSGIRDTSGTLSRVEHAFWNSSYAGEALLDEWSDI